MPTELETLQRALEEVEDRIRRRWTAVDSYYRSYLIREIEKLRLLRLEMVDVTIVIYSVCRGKKGEYDYRFQGFYDVDAWRSIVTGVIGYDAELTLKEIGECLVDFRMRWGWKLYGVPAAGVEEPVWVETSQFEREDEPGGASVKGLSKIEDDDEVYFGKILEIIYRPTLKEIEDFKRYGGGV